MDGYALRLATGMASLWSSANVFRPVAAPASFAARHLRANFTGAPLPAGRRHRCRKTPCSAKMAVAFCEPLKLGAKRARPGQETRIGDSVLPAGTRLGPIELGLAASLGCAELTVRRRPRVAMLSTGDELVEPGQPLGPGQIYNSNRRLLIAWLQRLGCEVVDGGILLDDLELTRAALGALVMST